MHNIFFFSSKYGQSTEMSAHELNNEGKKVHRKVRKPSIASHIELVEKQRRRIDEQTECNVK